MTCKSACLYSELLSLSDRYDIESLNEQLNQVSKSIFPDQSIEWIFRKDAFYLKPTTNIEFDIIQQDDGVTLTIVCENTPVGHIRAEKPLSGPQEQVLRDMLFLYFNMSNHIALSRIDQLTGVGNRQAFTYDINQLSNRQAFHGRRKWEYPKYLALMDIDNFKEINDRFGHLIGDEVLLMFGQQLLTAFREHDQCYRYGGEEFAVIINQSEVDSINLILERFRKTIEKHRFPQVGKVTVSIGYSIVTPGFIPSVLMDRVDRALYYSKKSGKNQVNDYVRLLTDGRLVEKAGSDIEFL